MSILITILWIIASVIALVLVLAFFMKKEHYVKREITINATTKEVFDFLKILKNQDKFNKWAKADAERHWQYKGTDGTVGFIIAWNGNKEVGQGEKEIINMVEGKSIETQIRFVKPMKMTSDIVMEMEATSNNQTKVYFSNAGTIKYPLNIFIPIAEKMFPKDMDESLVTLKNLLEKN